CHLSPNRLMSAMQSELESRGCEFHWDSECDHFQTRGNQVKTVETSSGSIPCDELVLCGGAWSPTLSSKLRISLPMQAGKGYSVTLDAPCQLPSICSILSEAKVAVTPMGSSLRFGGTMEIVGNDESVSPSRVRGIVRSIPEYYPQFQTQDFANCKPWVGLRPCSPDGLPYLGRTRTWENVVVSTGHAMMGISLAAVSGSLVADIIDDAKPAIQDLELLSPDRYT
ncbi:MAG: NAD(P)/FAD-dependent oxidoreductase, partial [Rubripirellula sp.]